MEPPPPYTTLYPPLNTYNPQDNLQRTVYELEHSMSIQAQRIHSLEEQLKQANGQNTSMEKAKNTHDWCTGKGYDWVSSSTYSGVPPMAIRMCADAHGNDIFIGRAHFCSELTPAHVVATQAAYVPHYGKEHPVDNYDVLCTNFLKWVPSSGGAVPPGAVQAGHNKDGAPLYVGRVHHRGCYIIGKVHPKLRVCYFPYQGKELSCSSYEVLIFGM